MAFEINCYNARKITAAVNHRNRTHWIELTVEDRGDHNDGDVARCTIFFHGPNAGRLADEYAAAINGVNEGPVRASPSVEPFPSQAWHGG